MSEISYSVNKVCQYMHNPLESYWVVVKHILRYLVGTLDHGLYLQRPSKLNLIGFCDSDLATDRDDKDLHQVSVCSYTCHFLIGLM